MILRRPGLLCSIGEACSRDLNAETAEIAEINLSAVSAVPALNHTEPIYFFRTHFLFKFAPCIGLLNISCGI